jgi:hypothetical protein
VEVVAEEVAVLEPGMVTGTGMGTGMVTVVEMVSPLVIAMVGRAPRSELGAELRSLRREARIALAPQPDGSPLRRRDGRIRPAG